MIISEHNLTTFENETKIIVLSFSIYQIQTVNPLVFCVDTGALHFCIRNEALERIVPHSGHNSIPVIDSKRGLKFDKKMVRSRGIIELMLPTS